MPKIVKDNYLTEKELERLQEIGVSAKMFKARINRLGWTRDQALNTPPKRFVRPRKSKPKTIKLKEVINRQTGEAKSKITGRLYLTDEDKVRENAEKLNLTLSEFTALAIHFVLSHVDIEEFEKWIINRQYEKIMIEENDFGVNDAVVRENIKELVKRSILGVKKYGTTLADSGLSFDEFLTHLQEELMDGFNYIRALKLEQKKEKDCI